MVCINNGYSISDMYVKMYVCMHADNVIKMGIFRYTYLKESYFVFYQAYIKKYIGMTFKPRVCLP